MTLTLMLELLAVSALIVAGTVRDYRLMHKPDLPPYMRLLHLIRLPGLLVLGFGVLGILLATAGYGGGLRFGQTVRIGVLFGAIPFVQSIDAVAETRFWEVSSRAIGLGALMVVLATLGLWVCAWRNGQGGVTRS
jgi:hypothetical protein